MQRLQAVRAAILLMPDENREVLQTLLYFLRDVTSLVEENQMTPMNLAVCLGPSLFHLSILKNETLSPRCIYELMNMLMLRQKKSRIKACYYIKMCIYYEGMGPNSTSLQGLDNEAMHRTDLGKKNFCHATCGQREDFILTIY